jgi:cell division protein FtsW
MAGVVAFQIPLRLWQQASPWLFLAGFALLLLVLMPHVGRSVNGAQRWINLGPVNLQPSELMKLFACSTPPTTPRASSTTWAAFCAASARWRW